VRILNAAQMREADRLTIEEVGLPSLVLMENAGRQVVAAMETVHESLLSGRVAILCGPGNNGGDGFVVARTLLQRDIDTAVLVVGPISRVRGDARVNLDILGRLGVTVVEIADEQSWDLHASEVGRCSLVVDAIFGTGLTAPLTGLLETIAADLNASGLPIVAIDLPTGLSSDTPALVGPCIHATTTVTLCAPKLPLVLPPAEARAGDVVIADIGIPREIIDRVDGPRISLLTPGRLREFVAPRPPESHKGDFGRVTVVAGSVGKSGAAWLTAMGALRSGAGLVTVATPTSVQPVVASMGPEFMTLPLPESDGMVSVDAVIGVTDVRHDVIACGPGLGRSDATGAFVRALLERATVPLVLDADALWVLGEESAALAGRDDRPVVVTPHPGEMARLLGTTIEHVQQDRLKAALDFAMSRHLFVVLKGHRTVAATPGGEIFINPTGNPGMATGGTGDVLTGVIAAWIAQLLDVDAACRLGVFLHGAAGDHAEHKRGQLAMTASDVVDHLGDAVAWLLDPGGDQR
jgi:NAD(P)H-hydrate epimerase